MNFLAWGQTQLEIANLMGVSSATVARARKRIRETAKSVGFPVILQGNSTCLETLQSVGKLDKQPGTVPATRASDPTPDSSPVPDAQSPPKKEKKKTSVSLRAVAMPPELGDGDPNDGGIAYARIIAYLNDHSGKHFATEGPQSIATRRKILTLWRRGYRGKDFKAVIDDRCEAWGDDPKMRQYLRPDTLFSGKFEGYLHASDSDE